MEIYIDPSDTDFVNNVAKLSKYLSESFEGRDTQTVEHDDSEIEAYAFECPTELDQYEFPRSERDLKLTADEITSQLDAEAWFEGDTLYIAS